MSKAIQHAVPFVPRFFVLFHKLGDRDRDLTLGPHVDAKTEVMFVFWGWGEGRTITSVPMRDGRGSKFLPCLRQVLICY